MSVLIFDTETTGFVQKSLPLDDAKQPHLLQLAARLDDDNRITRGLINLLVANGGVSISDGAYNAHKISNDIAESFGVSLMTALASFHTLAQRADVLVGHNIEYDMAIMKIAYARVNKLDKFTSDIQTKPTFCTKIHSTDLCKLPSPNGRSSYKWPTLEEAYKILVNAEGFAGAHDAMNDVVACGAVFYSIKQPQEAPANTLAP